MATTVQPAAKTHTDTSITARRAAALVATLTILRLLYSATLELAGDEAYYWVWSRHLDIGYYSKGPAIAWVIAAATRLFGDAEWAVRLPAVLASAISSWALYGLARRLYSPRVALRALVVAATMPLLLVGSLLMTIDPLSVAAWLIGAVALHDALRTNARRHWIGAGLAVAAGTLAKFTNLAQLPSYAIAAAICPDGRRLRRPGLWLAVGIGLLGLVPPLVWNWNHGWATLQHLRARGALDQPFRGDLLAMIGFLASQAAVLSPAYAAALIAGLRRQGGEEARAPLRFLAAFVLPLPLTYALVSLNGEWEPNWTAPALAMTPVLLAGLWSPAMDCNPVVRRRAHQLVAAHAVLAVTAHLLLLGPWIFGNDRFRRIGGARSLAMEVARARATERCDAVIAGGYQLASLLIYYTPGHPWVYTPPSNPPAHQFAFWPGYRDRPDIQRVLYVAKTEHLPDPLRRDFESVRALGWVHPVYRGRTMRPHHLTVLERRRHGAASDPDPSASVKGRRGGRTDLTRSAVSDTMRGFRPAAEGR
ncbi:MAG: glycosyltransferase family 39 protein [Kiritimatiellae bacterium]|nr:glycosyltransferase family 39 protein [Kiritimatiellia bacterium]